MNLESCLRTLQKSCNELSRTCAARAKLTEEHLDVALGGNPRSAARGRRQRRRGRRTARQHPRQGARLRSDAAAFARPAGGQDCSRRVAEPARQARQAAVCLAAAFGVDDCGPARFRQNHHHRQARQMACRSMDTGRSSFPPTSIARRRASSWRRWPSPSAFPCGPARARTSRWRLCAARSRKPSFPPATWSSWIPRAACTLTTS